MAASPLARVIMTIKSFLEMRESVLAKSVWFFSRTFPYDGRPNISAFPKTELDDLTDKSVRYISEFFLWWAGDIRLFNDNFLH